VCPSVSRWLPMSRTFLGLLVLGSVVLAAPPSADEIKKAVEDLASPRFAVRERASKALWEAGAAAETALREAAKSKDEETAARARTILEKFDWGLYPDTPGPLVKLIEDFRGGDANQRQQAILEMMAMKPPPFGVMRKVIAKEEDDNNRQEMYNRIAFKARMMVPELILSGKVDEANEMLEVCLVPKTEDPFIDYAAFHSLRGTVPDAIRRMEHLRQTGAEPERAKAVEALVYLHRVRKDWPTARKYAEESRNSLLIDALAWESDDWKTLAERNPDVGVDREDRGQRAAYYRLAGDKAKSDELIEELRKELNGVEGDDAAALVLADALMKNGRGGEAVAALKERTRTGAADQVFDYLCAQLNYRGAFAYADQVLKELAKDENAEFERNRLNTRRAYVLAALGDRDGATQLYRSVLDAALLTSNVASIYDVIATASRGGMRDLAAECAARAMSAGKGDLRLEEDSFFLEPVFEDRRLVVQTWWRALRAEKADADPTAVMRQMIELLDGKADRKKADALAAAVEKQYAGERKNDGLSNTITLAPYGPLGEFAIAEAYRAVGAKDKAEEFYKKATAADRHGGWQIPIPTGELLLGDELPGAAKNVDFLLRYGDFLLAEKRYKEAAALFQRAWTANPLHPLALFLQGHALKLAGDVKEGERRMDLAHWMPLGSEVRRATFADELNKRGFNAASRREMDLVLETGWYRSHFVGNMHLRKARQLVRKKDYAEAARMFEKDVISLMRTGAHFTDSRANLTIPEQARTYRARALLAAGKLDEALAEARIGLDNLPDNIDLAMGLVPDLDAAGRKKEGDELYAKVKNAYAGALADHGKSPELRNALAWTMVNCNRDLDEAQKHAEVAVQVAPKVAGYIDTLAEIHFRKKDRARALELMKQSVALEPTNPYYRKQIERFETKPFDSPLPDEETGDE
jgi:tetratricopeptide (TPR) repeat protein